MTTNAPIACATDLKRSGAIAVDWAGLFAERLGLPVRLIHAKGEPEPPLETEVPDMMRDVAAVYNERITEAKAALRHALDAQSQTLRSRGVAVEAEVLEGRAASALEAELERQPVTLLVVGPHTRILDDALVDHSWLPFGTTAERLAHAGLAPVFVARTEGPSRSDRLQLLFDLESAPDAPQLEARARDLARALDADFFVVDHEADLRAMPEGEPVTRVLVTAANRDPKQPGFVLAAPATRRLRRFPFPVLALPRTA